MGSLFTVLVVLITTIFAVASSSIGIQAYNENPDYNPKPFMGFIQLKREDNKNFLIANLVIALVSMVVVLGGMYMSATPTNAMALRSAMPSPVMFQ
jgi:hypothetical protein